MKTAKAAAGSVIAPGPGILPRLPLFPANQGCPSHRSPWGFPGPQPCDPQPVPTDPGWGAVGQTSPSWAGHLSPGTLLGP